MAGWTNIILEMKEKLKPYDVHIIEIKEKWGVLKVIYNFEGTETDKNELQKIIDEAEEKSSVTCEICGNPGEFINNHGWLKTLCNNCRMETEHQPKDEPDDPYPLSAKPDDLQRWIQEGKKKGANYLIEMTDSFDWQDYPVYVMPGEDLEKIKAEKTQDMVYVSRIIDLRENNAVFRQQEVVIKPPDKTRFNWLKITDVIFGSVFFLIFLYPQLKWNIIPIKLFALLAQAWIIYFFLRVLIYHFSLNKSTKETINRENPVPESENHTSSLRVTHKIDFWIERVKGIISLIAFSAIGILFVIQILKGHPVGTMLFSVIVSVFCFALGILSFFAVFSSKNAENNDKSGEKVGGGK
jgi:hypothetical protein